MKKKGSVLIECLIALVIFLIGIIPITKFTLNSLGLNNRSGEIEEAARITTTVIDYIKSENYTDVLENNLKVDSSKTETYEIASGSVDIGSDDNNGNKILDSSFDLDSRGIDLDEATLTISMMKTNLLLVSADAYTNPVNESKSKVMFGTNGLLEDQPIYGRVTLSYKSKKDNSGEPKEYGQNFILVPMENWN
jgi:hypothetical protein